MRKAWGMLIGIGLLSFAVGCGSDNDDHDGMDMDDAEHQQMDDNDKDGD